MTAAKKIKGKWGPKFCWGGSCWKADFFVDLATISVMKTKSTKFCKVLSRISWIFLLFQLLSRFPAAARPPRASEKGYKTKHLSQEFFFLWAASDCRSARCSRFQRLRVTNLHRKISKKSKIGLLEVKLQHKVQNIFWGTKNFENFQNFRKNRNFQIYVETLLLINGFLMFWIFFDVDLSRGGAATG